MGDISLTEIDSLVENLRKRYCRLMVEAEDILWAGRPETNWDDVYLRKICEEKYYDWQEDKSA